MPLVLTELSASDQNRHVSSGTLLAILIQGCCPLLQMQDGVGTAIQTEVFGELIHVELLGWVLLVVVFAGPYVVGGLGVVAMLFVICRLAYSKSRKTGRVITTLLAAGVLTFGSVYLIQGPVAFSAACDQNGGVHVYQKVIAEPYFLNLDAATNIGLASSSDATAQDAVRYVANGYVDYVEVQDSGDNSRLTGLLDGFERFRNSSVASGYFRIYRDSIGSERCRWLTAENVRGLPYWQYLELKLDHPLNAMLREVGNKVNCIAIDYVASPSARYMVRFQLNQNMGGKLAKHEIQLIDIQNNNQVIGDSVAYEYMASGVFDSVAFWVGNAGQHSRCPLNLLVGRPIYEILSLETRRRHPSITGNGAS